MAEHNLDWKGDHPYFLAIREYADVEFAGGGKKRTNITTIIDLDEKDWLKVHAGKLRVPGVWMLCSKKRSHESGVITPLLMVRVEEGEQPYYVAKHIGVLNMPGMKEVICYGIGKKRVDGVVDRLWLFPNGMVGVGEDVYRIGSDMVKGQL